MALEVYRQKRNFKISPEPQGRISRRKTRELVFVVQKHAASHLHYDFRLELDGVLLSWAVPKGPSLDPNHKRLAMHVEDHPLEYGAFEGIIPAKQYGAGTVLLWDKGSWIPKEDPVPGYKKGKLKYDLAGEKLRGGWTLVRTRSSKYGGDKAWLLIKEDDEFARRGPEALIVNERPKSVASGRTIEEIAARSERVWHSNKSVAENVRSGAVKKQRKRGADLSKIEGAVRAELPNIVKPQLATLVKDPPTNEDWVEEMKLDGYRMLCRIENGAARMISRTGQDWSARFKTIVTAVAQLPVENAWIDGEVVVLDSNGRSSFQALQNALSLQDKSELYYYVFDLPFLNGFDLRHVPLLDRKRLLEPLLESAPERLKYSVHLQGEGGKFFREACKLHLEGIIAKLAGSRYQAGRSRSWVKVKCDTRQEMVIGGYTDPEGSRNGLGALLLGVYEPDGNLRYSGKVGTGFNDKTLMSLRRRLDGLLQDEPAFSNPPKGAEARRAHWVKPTLVAEVKFSEWTDDGTLRHPSFQGLREDKKATEVIRERPVSGAVDEASAAERTATGSVAQRKPKTQAKRVVESALPTPVGKDVVAGIRLSNAAKLLYPDCGLSKRDLALYYQTIGDWILPHLQQRPLSLVRCPNGWQKQCFYQKNVDASVDKAIDRVAVQTSEGKATYMMANSVSALAALAQMGVLELHPWGSSAGNLEFPDRIVFDFDPDDGLPWKNVVEAVQLIKTLLEKIGLQGFLKTTGGKGLHVVVPIEPTSRWDAVKGFSKAIAELFAGTFPDRFTAKIAKPARQGRIFIDYLRNDEGSTAIAAYSPRARAKAPVSVPITWDELSKDVRFDHFTIQNVPARLKRLKREPWHDFFEIRQKITAEMMASVGYLHNSPAGFRSKRRKA